MFPLRPLRRQLRQLAVLGCSALCALAAAPGLRAADPTPVSTDERITRLEQRVENVDRSLERILLLLQRQQPAAAAQPAVQPVVSAVSAPASTAVPAGTAGVTLQPTPIGATGNLKPGVLQDVWLRPIDFSGGVPTTPSLVTINDTRGPLFQLERYANEPGMAGNVGKPVVQVWRCHLLIKRAGTHVLIAEFQRAKDRMVAKAQKWDDFLFSWSAQLTLGPKLLLDETNRFENVGKGTLSRTFTLELEPGYYPVQIVTWMPKQDADEEYNLKPLTFALRLREPGELKPRALGPADFFRRE